MEILKAKILIVDDDKLNVILLKGMLEKADYKNITVTTDSREAFSLYKKIKPDLLILDLNMPHLSGFDVMAQLKDIKEESYFPIIILSGEKNNEIRFKALKSGAKDFLNKPYDKIEVLIRIRNIIEVRLLHNKTQKQNKLLEKKIKERTKKLYDTEIEFIQRLAYAVEFRDLETGIHVARISEYAECLAKKIGLKKDQCKLIKNASPLHDIGKIGIPDKILTKNSSLTDEEWEIMKTHTTIGGKILSESNSKFINAGKEIALTHHEKWNGTGYPSNLKGEEIPLNGRICCICDVFDALISDRPYKKAWKFEDAIEEMKRGVGIMFDPYIINAFFSLIPELRIISEKYKDTQQDIK